MTADLMLAAPDLPWTAVAAAAGAVGLAAGGFHYAALWPTSRLFGRTLVAGNDPAEVALTFDDGPNDPYTQQLIDVLARHRVTAAFFVIGKYVREKPHIVRALHQAGHTLGCHTMTHPALMYMGRTRIRTEVADATALIEDAIGDRVRYFRPPFGSRNPAVFAVLRELNLIPVLWNVTGRDWNARSAAEIEHTLQRGIVRNQRLRRGSNLLLHDGGHLQMKADRRRTVTATANILAMAPRGGVRFVALDHWRGLLPIAQQPL